MIPNPMPNVQAMFGHPDHGYPYSRTIVAWDENGHALIAHRDGSLVQAQEQPHFTAVRDFRPASHSSAAVPGLYV